ncbi:MAG: PAS domain S-box protein [Pirellulales bacterium]|nr:PAS domain S-box protein [Pirellulales bacterium]
METVAITPLDTAAGAEQSHDPLRRQQAVVALGRRAVAAPDSEILLHDAAALIADMVGTDRFLVAESDPNGGQLTLQLVTRQRYGGNKPLVHHVALDGAQSLAGYVLQVGHPVAAEHLAADRRFQDRFLSRHGIQSALAVPLCLPHRSFGALAACSSHERIFDAGDLLFAETVAHVVTTAVARCRVEQALATERRLSAGMLQTVGAIVLVLDARGQIVHINEACQRLTGFSLDEIRRRPVWDVLPVAEELDLFKSIFDGLRHGLGPVQFESCLLTKHSERRRVAWTYNTVCDAQGEIESILATGIDITEQQKRQQPEETPDANTPAGNPPSEPEERNRQHPNAADSRKVPVRRPSPINVERRSRPRRSYPYRQSIAPVQDGELPDPAEFYQVQCNDIAAGGFSFLSPRPPESASIVVALGTPPSLTYLHAQIAHVTRMRKEGKWVYLVGCSYTGRAFY